MFFLLKAVMKDYLFLLDFCLSDPTLSFPTVTDVSVVVLNDLHPEYNYTLS